jgi:heptosyltransferase-2
MKERVQNIAGTFSLVEFAMVVKQARFVISNDSSPVHFASAFDIPVLAIFGPTIPAFGFAPTSTINRVVSIQDQIGMPLDCQPCAIHGTPVCPLGHHRCMKDLEPTTVFNYCKKTFIKELPDGHKFEG